MPGPPPATGRSWQPRYARAMKGDRVEIVVATDNGSRTLRDRRHTRGSSRRDHNGARHRRGRRGDAHRRTRAHGQVHGQSDPCARGAPGHRIPSETRALRGRVLEAILISAFGDPSLDAALGQLKASPSLRTPLLRLPRARRATPRGARARAGHRRPAVPRQSRAVTARVKQADVRPPWLKSSPACTMRTAALRARR